MGRRKGDASVAAINVSGAQGKSSQTFSEGCKKFDRFLFPLLLLLCLHAGGISCLAKKNPSVRDGSALVLLSKTRGCNSLRLRKILPGTAAPISDTPRLAQQRVWKHQE